MSSRILGVHLTSRRMCIAAAESTLGSVKVTTIVDFGLDKATSMARMISDQSWDRVIASLPGDAAAFRFLDFPFRDKRRLDQAVGSALEEHVPLDLENSVCSYDFSSPAKSGRVLAAMADSQAVSAQLAALAEHGVEPSRLVWAPPAAINVYRKACGPRGAYTAVDVSADGAIVGVIEDNELQALRILRHCPEGMLVRNLAWTIRTISPAGDRLVLGGPAAGNLTSALGEALPDRKLEALPEECPLKVTGAPTSDWRAAAPAVGLIMAAHEGAGEPVIDFSLPARSESRSYFGAPTETRATATWAAAAVVLALTANVLEYTRLSGQRRDLRQQAESIYQGAMHSQAAGPGMTLKMEMRLKELQRRTQEGAGGMGTSSPLKVLALLSAAIPGDLEVEFDTFVTDPPNLKFTGRGPSFEAVTKLQESLEGNENFATIEVRDVRAAVDGSGVDFQLLMKVGDIQRPT